MWKRGKPRFKGGLERKEANAVAEKEKGNPRGNRWKTAQRKGMENERSPNLGPKRAKTLKSKKESEEAGREMSRIRRGGPVS